MPRSGESSRRRRETLADLLSRRQSVSTSELARRFDVSEMTIRRDLKVLEQQGLAVPCYGGAMPAQRITFEFAFDERHRCRLTEKRRIGQAAAERVQPGQTVFLDTGTTTLEVARALATRQVDCEIITSSLVIASELWGQPTVTLQLLGGRVRLGSPDLTGPYSESMLDRFTADLALLGSEGLDPARGVFAADTETARIAERMARHACRTLVVTDSSKLGRAGPVRYLTIDQVDEAITDTSAPPAVLKKLRAADITVHIV